MKSIFEEFYYGKLGMREERPTDKEYEKADEEFGKVYDKVESVLPEKHKKLLGELYLRGADVTAMLEYLSYKEGFRVALRLAFELMGEPSPN